MVPSPSRWWSEKPFRPISALHGGLAAAQQEPVRCHSCSVARLVLALGASTLTNWRAFPVDASLVGRLAGHSIAFSSGAAGLAQAGVAGPATVPKTTSHRAARAARPWRRPAIDLGFWVIFHSYQLKLALTALLIAGAAYSGHGNVPGTYTAAAGRPAPHVSPPPSAP